MLTYKKILSLILTAILLLSISSCDPGGDSTSTLDDTTTSITTDAESTEDDSSVSYESDDTSAGSEASEGASSTYDESEESIVESSEHSGGEYSDVESSDASESSELEESSETSEELYERQLAESFKQYAAQVDYEKVWENNGLELYNTDFRMSDKLAEKFIKRFSSFSNAQSVMLIELDTNMAFAFSKDKKIATASSIKGPMGLYVNKCIDAGLISWDTTKTYQPRHFQAHSTGKVQNSNFGTAFKVSKLMDYMIRISDNQAYLMLKEMVKASNFNYMMETLGCTQIIPDGSNWGYITAQEMAAAWREIYYYSLATESGAELFDRYMHAQYNYIWRSIPQYEAAHKSGWSGKAFNDAGVVFADGHEYVLVVLCGRSGVDDPRSQVQFTAITKLLAELMVEYNAYIENGADTESANAENSVISDEE